MSLDSAIEAFRAGRFREAHDVLLRVRRGNPGRQAAMAATALLCQLHSRARRIGVRRHRCVHRLAAMERAPVVALHFASSQVCLSGTTRGALQLWNLHTGQSVGELTGHHGRIRTIAVAGGAPVVASVDDRRHLRVWEMDSMSCRIHLDHSDYDDDLFHLFAVSHDGARGFSTDGVAQGYQWDLDRGRLMRHFDLVTSGAPVRALFSPARRGVIFLEHLDGTWARLDMASDHIEACPVPEAASSPGYRTVVVGQRVILRHAAAGDDLYVLDGHTEPVLSAAIAPAELMVLSGDAGGEIRAWDLEWELEFEC